MKFAHRNRIGLIWGWLFCCLYIGQAAAYEDPAREVSAVLPGAINSVLIDLEVAGDQLVAVGERGHVLVGARDGQAWRQAHVPTQRLLTAVSFADENNGWAVGHDHIILHTNDGGASWSMQWENIANELPAPLLGVDFVSPLHGWAVGAYGAIFETRNGGKSWKDIKHRIDNPDEWHNYAVASWGDGSVYLCGESGTFYRSNNFGSDWEKLEVPYDGSLFGVLALSDREVILHGLRGTVLYSSDRGDSWRKIDIASEEGVLAAARVDDDSVAFVGSNGLISILSLETLVANTRTQKSRVSLSDVVALGDGRLGVIGLNGFQTAEN